MFEKKIEMIIEAIFEKKGFDVNVIDLREISPIADYFVVCTGISSVQTQAIADNVARKLKRSYKVSGIEGEENGLWILLDYSDVLVHVFQPHTREKYGLEHLWADGKITSVEDKDDSAKSK